eukprot:TRINITY_DN10176_c0_g1_i2.p1 TRINITY_DN10176_c0_g1~~TRINITY_DN10176_c0_g1_i2.p1  ORF type:complete len:620 (-),score=112.45 TRINITY_DN10176_c0_g1_i2:100-1959(-)
MRSSGANSSICGRPSDSERLGLVETVGELWTKGCFCDVTLKARDGQTFQAHRLILSAASEPLAALLGGQFAEGQQVRHGAPVALDVPSEALRAALDYIYGRPFHVEPDDAPEALKAAHLYGLQGFVSRLADEITRRLDLSLALRTLLDCEFLGLDDLEICCERYVAERFEECATHEAFPRLSAAQLGRLLKDPALETSSEEAVLRAVLRWYRAAAQTQRGKDTIALLLQDVDFPSLSLRSLHAAERLGHTLGPCGNALQREVRRALTTHREADGPSDGPRPKRRCLRHWWPGLGASMSGGTVVVSSAAGLGAATSLALLGDKLIVGDSSSHRVLRFAIMADAPSGGSQSAEVLAGKGASRSDACTELSEELAIAVDAKGHVLIADECRLLRLDASQAARVLLPEAEGLVNVSSNSNGDIYVLDQDGTRVQRLRDPHDGSGKVEAVTVAGGLGEGPAATQFGGTNLLVTDDGTLYISDHTNQRVQRWKRGASSGETVAGGNGRGSAANQLSLPGGLAVTGDGTVFVADICNHRVVKWHPGARSGVVVAGGHGRGNGSHQLDNPADVALGSDGALYVLEAGNRRVTRWGPAPDLDLEDEKPACAVTPSTAAGAVCSSETSR